MRRGNGSGLGWLVGLVALFFGSGLGPVAWAESAGEPPIRILFVTTDETAPGVAAGVALGLDEANHLGQFTGHRFALDTVSAEAVTAEAATTLEAGAHTVVVAAVPGTILRRLAETWGAHDTAVLNVASADDALRDGCFSNLLHVAPSEGMLAAAARQWILANPEGSSTVTARAWHPDFVKYAARDLNKRFLRSQGMAMDDAAWAGWAAVKMMAEAVARTGDPAPGVILAYLRDTLAFDGQKGIAHRFHTSGQLRQPVLLEVDGELVGEAPVRGVVDIEDLESLGFEDFPRCEPGEKESLP